MISLRYAPAVTVLVGVALVPTVLHTYVGATANDGRTSQQVARRLDGLEGIDTSRDADWVRQYFHTSDFIERRYDGGVTLFVARGFDAKALYHHPELGLAYARTFNSSDITDIAGNSGNVVLHVLRGPDHFACYALLYGEQFVGSPAPFEARRAIGMLFGPRREMTLFFAHGPAARKISESPVTRTVLAAIDSFRTPVAPAAQ